MVAGPSAFAPLRVAFAERGDRGLLAGFHCLGIDAAGVQQLQALAQIQHEPGEAVGDRVIVALRRRQAARGAPFAQALALHEAGEGFVERAVAFHVDQLVRQLVEDRAGQLVVVPAQHAGQHRIGKPAQRRIRRHAADPHIVTAGLPARRIGLRRLFAEPAPVSHATGDRKALRHRLHRMARRSEHVPHHVVAIQRHVAGVAAIVRQAQLARGEPARLQRQAQARGQLRVGVRVGEHALDRASMHDEFGLPVGGLRVVAHAGAGGQGKSRHHQEGKPEYRGGCA